MKRFIPTLLLLIPLQSFAAPQGKDILLKMNSAIKSHQSANYRSIVKYKPANSKDTSTTSGRITLMRGNDSLFGGKIWYSSGDRSYSFYDLKKIYVVDRKAKKAKIYDAHQEAHILRDNPGYGLVWKDFLDQRELEQRIATGKIQLMKDTLISGREHYRVQLAEPDDKIATQLTYVYCIDKQNYLPTIYNSTASQNGRITYYEQQILSCTLDSVKASRFSASQIPPDHKKEIFDREAERKKLLEPGIKAPVITGKNYKQKWEPKTVKFDGKVTLLDFWFMACGPCASAFEQIKRIHEKYEDNYGFQICGVNSIDNNEERMRKVPQKLGYHDLIDAQYLVDRSLTFDDYHVFTYPTFYLVDKKGNIAYAASGYSDTMFSSLTHKIDELLKQ